MASKGIWIVVEVQSGIPVNVKAFSSYESANKYSELIKNGQNPDNDEIGIFHIDID